MKITHCKIIKKSQKRLLEFFVVDVTARAAALFYYQTRLIIEYHLTQEAKGLFDGKIELDESYFGGVRKGKRGRGATVDCRIWSFKTQWQSFCCCR